ncbi:glycosyltransferase [Nonomuraea sp. SMC257]|uniref:Glycosyltransferase n=1 Tax=Nonomuraea montanisoli TaxID=2741721 RepID=A0A7Y6IDW2_9ACTN|nr:glycosyltransferase [Nonomuraea montanisoli]NUW36465.1 glycosyltransferase [Nonomuraea montanisoli]
MGTSGEPSGLRRVALLIGQLGLGGAEKQVSLLARELHSRNIAVDVLLLSKGGPHEATLRAAGIHVHHLGFTRTPSGSIADPRNVRAFARLVLLLRRLRPDVLHAYLLHSYLIGAPAALLARVPVMVAGRRGLSDIKRKQGRLFSVGSAMTAITDHVVANAAAVAEDARTVEGIPPHKLSVIYNGLSDAALEVVEPATVDTRLPVVVCLARLRPEKGHDCLLDAAALLAREGRRCTWLLVGDGPETERLQARAHALDVDVRFWGAVTDPRPLLARADVVVLPSVSEGLSNAIMEAMVQRRPIVATAVGGTPELLGDDRGVLIPHSDPAALARAVAGLLDDPGHAARLGAEARAWVLKNLDATTMVEEHLALYRGLLARR